jgi:hypothetical protein
MKKNKNAPNDVLQASRQLFETTCNRVLSSLGDKPFHIRTGLNTAVFDSVMVAFSNYSGAIPEDILERFERLIKDAEFDRDTKQATTDVDTVKNRFRRAETILFR